MYALAFITVAFLLAGYAESVPSLKVLKNVYADFVVKYGRVHKDEVEGNMRFGLFLQRLQKIEELNKRKDGAVYGITKFADWTQEERSKLLMKKTELRKMMAKIPTEKYEKVNKATPPESFDWRTQGAVTPIKNQANCGSCYAFASMALVESLYAIKTGQMVDLSEQQLVDCTPYGYGCEGANEYNSLMFLRNKGALTEAEYPYKEVEISCPSKSGKIFVKTVPQLMTSDDMVDYLANTSPFVMGFTCPDSIFDYVSGVYNPSSFDCYTTSGGHAVEVVGYGVENGVKYWLIKNSWDTDFGENGYFKFIRGENVCDNEDYNHGASLA